MRNTKQSDRRHLWSPSTNLLRVTKPQRSNSGIAVPARVIFTVLSAILILITSACNLGSASPTPTVNVDAIYTAAFQTFTSQQATQFASTPPTDTPAPTAFPTLPPAPSLMPFGTATTSAGGGLGCDNSIYVSDVTIPDGTVIAAGKSFVKTWQIKNNGTCPWSTFYQLGFSSGDAMGGNSVAMTAPVPAGQQVNISVNLVAPSTDGSYKGNWQMKNDKSISFGNIITVVIKVGNGATATPGPSPTPGPTSATGNVTISGRTGAADTTISYTGGTDFLSDSSGNYSFTVTSGWSGTVTPSKGKYIFSPDSRTYTNVTSNMTGQNFSAALPTATH